MEKQNKKQNVLDIETKRYIKREENTTKIVFSIIIFSFIILTGGIIYNFITNTPVPTTSVVMQTFVSSNFHKGIIVREEQAYFLDFFGAVRFEAEEYSRIRSGDRVAIVEDTVTIAPFERENRILQAHILGIQEFRSHISIHAENAAILNDNIRVSAIENLHRIGDDSNFAHAFSERMDSQLYMRNNLLLSETVGSVAEYVNILDRNSRFIESNQREIIATNGGIVTRYVDGHEYLTIENITRLSSDFLDILEETNTNTSGIFRIVTSNVWHIASFFEPAEVRHLNNGQNINIYMISYDEYNNYIFRSVPATVNYMGQRDNKVFVVFSMRDFMIDYIDYRIHSFTLHYGNVTGLAIPNEAIATRTLLMIPSKYVYTDLNYNNFVTIENLSYNNMDNYGTISVNPVTVRSDFHGYGYIFVVQDFGTLSLGSVLIGQDGSRYAVNRVITDTGVFRVNNGVATFVSIDTTNKSVFDDYTIISVVDNQGRGGLVVHDRIVANTQDYLVYAGLIVQ